MKKNLKRKFFFVLVIIFLILFLLGVFFLDGLVNFSGEAIKKIRNNNAQENVNSPSASSNNLKTYLPGYMPNRIIVKDLMDDVGSWEWWSSYNEWTSIPFGQDLGEKGAAKYVYDVKLSDGKNYPKAIMVRPNDAEGGSTNAEFDLQLPNVQQLYIKMDFGYKNKNERDFVYLWLPEVSVDGLQESIIARDSPHYIATDLSKYAGQTIHFKLSINKAEESKVSEIYITKLMLFSPQENSISNSIKDKEWFNYPLTFSLSAELHFLKLMEITNTEWISAPADRYGKEFIEQTALDKYTSFINTDNIFGVRSGDAISSVDFYANPSEIEEIYPGMDGSVCEDSYGAKFFFRGMSGNYFRSMLNPVFKKFQTDQLKFLVNAGSSTILLDNWGSNKITFEDAWFCNDQEAECRGCYNDIEMEMFKEWLREEGKTKFYNVEGEEIIHGVDEVTPEKIDYVHYGEDLFDGEGNKLFDIFKNYTDKKLLETWTGILTEVRNYAKIKGKHIYFTANVPDNFHEGYFFEAGKLLDYITYEQVPYATMQNSRERWEGKYGLPMITKHNAAIDDRYTPDQNLIDWFSMATAKAYASMAKGNDKFALVTWIGGISGTNLKELSKYHKFILTNTLFYENLNNNKNPLVTHTGSKKLVIEPYVGNENKRLIFHLVNTDFNENTLKINPKGAFSLSVEIPKDFLLKNKKAYLISPDNGQVIELKPKISQGKASFDIPKIYIYSVLIITEENLFKSSRKLHEANLLSREAKWDDTYLVEEDKMLDNALTAFNKGNYEKALQLSEKAYKAISAKIKLKDEAYAKIVECERIKSCDPSEAKKLFYAGDYEKAMGLLE